MFIVQLFSCSVVQLFSSVVQLSVVSCQLFLICRCPGHGRVRKPGRRELAPRERWVEGSSPGRIANSHRLAPGTRTHQNAQASARTTHALSEDGGRKDTKNQKLRTKNQEPRTQEPRYRIPIPLLILESPRRPSRRRPTRPGRARVRLESWALSREPSAWLRREEEGE